MTHIHQLRHRLRFDSFEGESLMSKVHTIDKKHLEQLVTSCQAELLVSEPILFHYPDTLVGKDVDWDNYTNRIKLLNADLLRRLKHNANIYAIHVKEKNSSWQVVYIGQRKSKNIRERMIQHLVKKNKSTGSKLLEVKDIILNGGQIGVSFTKVEPESLRLYVEETMIQQNSQALIWNKHK